MHVQLPNQYIFILFNPSILRRSPESIVCKQIKIPQYLLLVILRSYRLAIIDFAHREGLFAFLHKSLKAIQYRLYRGNYRYIL